MEELKNKLVFISPVDWGLGHSSRCIQIIEELITRHNKVIIGVTDLNKNYFNAYFPLLQKVEVPSYNIKYSKFWPAWLKVLFQWRSILSAIRSERAFIYTLAAKNPIDVIISDCRFGLCHSKIKSYFITHQLNIQVPFLGFFVNQIHRRYVHRFEEVWVPDYADKHQRLSGKLSDARGIMIPVKYIGPKSALTNIPQTLLQEKKIDVLILLSGTEPERSILEQQLLNKFGASKRNVVLVRGTQKPLVTTHSEIQIYDEVFGEKLKRLILNAQTIICRSGYSTLMDLHLLNKTQLILIPTRGQTEQEYLARHWKTKFKALVYTQKQVVQIPVS